MDIELTIDGKKVLELVKTRNPRLKSAAQSKIIYEDYKGEWALVWGNRIEFGKPPYDGYVVAFSKKQPWSIYTYLTRGSTSTYFNFGRKENIPSGGGYTWLFDTDTEEDIADRIYKLIDLAGEELRWGR